MFKEIYSYIIGHWDYILGLIWVHLKITGTAMFFAILVAVPVGILLTRFRKLSTIVIGAVGILQTIPSLALLALMIPFFGIGFKPAVIALFLYALLPIVRNTYIGVRGVTPELVEAARGLGMTRLQVLIKVQVPIALPVIIAGIRTSTVICVGTATIAALIGSGGLGSLIYRGLQQLKATLIVTGAFFSAILALGLDYGLGAVEFMLTSKGLRGRQRSK